MNAHAALLGRLLPISTALSLLASPSPAQEEPGFLVSAAGGGLVTLSGSADTEVQPWAIVTADGPLVLGSSAPLRLFVKLSLTSAPGETVDLASVQSFRAGGADLGLYRRIGRAFFGDQEITTSVIAFWGFQSRLDTDDQEPASRLSRRLGIGFRFAVENSGAQLTLAYGRDEVAGPKGWGQTLVSGRLPVPGTRQILLLAGDAVLAVGPRHRPGARDTFRIGVLADIAEALR